MATEGRRRWASYAKVNLHLQVVGRRADGYHELRTIFQSVDLADDVEIDLGGDGVRLEVEGDGVPAGPTNLAHRAASGFVERWAPGVGVRIRLRKRIPVGGGLGGGSSNAGTVLRALQSLLGEPAPPAELWQLARSLGADVPYFLVGGTALGVGRGDEVVPLPNLPSRRILLAMPGLDISTPAVFGALGDLTADHLDPRITADVQSGRVGWDSLAAGSNDLESSVFDRWPQMAAVRRALADAGATVVRLSGSGSTVFALFDPIEAHDEPIDGVPGCRFEMVATVPRETFLESRVVGS